MAEELLDTEVEQPQTEQPTIPYIKGVYTNLQHAYGKDNLPDEKTFTEKMMKDNIYRSGVRDNLVHVYGKDNVPELSDFESKLGVEKKNQVGNVSANGTSNTSKSTSPSKSTFARDFAGNSQIRTLSDIQAEDQNKANPYKVTQPTNLPKNDAADYAYKLKTQEAIKNTLAKNYEAHGQTFDENTPAAKKGIEQMTQLAQNQDIAVVEGSRDGKPYVTRGDNFLKSLWDGIVGSVTDTKDAARLNTFTNAKELAVELNKQAAEEPNIPTHAPAGLGTLGQSIGGLPKMAGEAAIPYAGEALMVSDAYQTSRAKQMKRLYWDGKNQGLSDEEAAHKAMLTSLVSAIPDAATALAMNRIGGGVEMNPAAIGFRNALKSAVKSVPKVSGIFGAGAAAKDLAEKAAGYDRHDILEHTIDAMGEGALMDASFKALHGVMPLAKYGISSAKEYLTSLHPDLVKTELSNMGEDGQNIARQLQSYQAARQKVEGLVPEEHISNFAGLIEKQDNIKKQIQDLEIRKSLVPEVLHGKINEQIEENSGQVAAIDTQLEKMAKSPDPSKLERDDLTGQKAGSVPKEPKNTDDGIFTTLQHLQKEPSGELSAEKMPDLSERVYKELEKSQPEGTFGSREVQRQVQNEIEAIFGRGNDKEGTLRNMSESELRDASRRLQGAIRGEVVLPEASQTIPHEGELGAQPIKGEQGINQTEPTSNPNRRDIDNPLPDTSGSANSLKNETTQDTKQSETQSAEPSKLIENIGTTKKEEVKSETIDLENSRTTSIKNEVTKNERAEKGLGEVEVMARRTFGDVFEKGKEQVDKGEIDPRLLAKEINKKPRPLKPEESIALLYDRMRLRNEHAQVGELLKNAHESNDAPKKMELGVRLAVIEDAINENDIAARKTGYEQGLGLAIRKLIIKEDYSLANQLQQFRSANGGEDISPEIRKKIEKLTSDLNDSIIKIDKYEKELANKKASNNISQIAKSVQKNKKSTSEFKTERDNIYKNINEKWKNSSKDNTLTAVPVPYAKQLAAITPDVTKLIKSYAEQGITELSKIVEDITDNLKKYIPEITNKDVTDILAGVYNSEKKQVKLDPVKMRLQANMEKIKDQINIEKHKIQQQNRTKFEKGLDFFAKFRRAVILSSVKTLGKLSAAATYRQMTGFIEDAIGGGISKIPGISEIAKGAPREGGLNLDAEVKSISQWWQKATYQDMKQILKTGKGELDYLYGDKKAYPPELFDFIGYSHAAFKAPAKRAEFFRSFEKRMKWAAENGKDITNPVTQLELQTQAYMDANRAIFMNPNKITDAYQRFINYLEREGGDTGKVGATGLKVLLPIVRIPTNYVNETLSYTFGWAKVLPKVAKAIKNGTDSLTPDQKDYVIRNIKKGSVGVALLAMGYFNPQQFGGYYTGKRREGDKKAGDLEIFGIEIPHFLLHAPFIEALQFGATLRRVHDVYSESGESEVSSFGKGTIKTGIALAKEVPFVSEMTGISKASESPEKLGDFSGDLAKSIIVPPDLQNIARITDKDEFGNEIKRKPHGIIENIESGIPGLRKNLDKAPVRTVINSDDKDWQILKDKKVSLPDLDINQVKIKEKDGTDRKMTDEEFDKFFKIREDFIKEKINKLKSSGRYVLDNGSSIRKNIDELSTQQMKDFIRLAEADATQKAKEKLFGKHALTIQERITQKRNRILNR